MIVAGRHCAPKSLPAAGEEYDDYDEFDEEWDELVHEAETLWMTCTSGSKVNEDDLSALLSLTEDCTSSAVLDLLTAEPAEVHPLFSGPWGDNRCFGGYVGAIWKALLWRSPSALRATGLESASDFRRFGEKLIGWGTILRQHRLDLLCCEESKPSRLLLWDQQWRNEEDCGPDAYEPKMPPTGHAKSGAVFRKLGLFGVAACRAYDLAEAVQAVESERIRQAKKAAKKIDAYLTMPSPKKSRK